MAIPNPNPNIADGIKSDNKTYSSNKIESLIKTATELPIPEAGDAGKVLTVNSDSDGYELDSPVDPTSIIDDSASSETTVYSSDKVDTITSPISELTETTATVTVHSDVTTGDVSDAVIARRGNIVIVRFESTIKAGTYTNLYTVTPVPSVKQLAVVDISGTTKTISVSTSGVIAFTQSTTLGSDGAIRGQIVYII